MLEAPIPEDDAQRLAELHALGLLDSDPDPAFDRITRLASRMFGVPTALVSLVDRDRQWFKSRIGLNAPETTRDISFCGHSIMGTEVFVVENAAEDDRFHDNPLVTEDPSIRFYAGAPLRTPSGAPIGTLCLIDGQPRSMSNTELENLRDLAEIIEDEIAQICCANTDSLTGLLNRRGFFAAGAQLLSIAQREDMPVTLAYTDIDGLKAVNDELGHHIGDDLIRSAGRVLSHTIRDSDVASRLGGDEFAVLFYGLSEEYFDVRHERFMDAIADYNRTSGRAIPISFSFGYVEWSAPEGLSELLERGDKAMYDVKLQRRALRGGGASTADAA